MSKDWISKAVNPKHKGFCSPITKSTCTPRRKAFAMTMKKHHGFHKKELGGSIYAKGGFIEKNYFYNPFDPLNNPEQYQIAANGGDIPMYNFGSWLGNNAVPLLSTAGGIASEVVAPGNPIGIGMIASGVGGLASNNLGKQTQVQNNGGMPNAPQPMQSPYAAYGGNLIQYNTGGSNPLTLYNGNPHSKGGIKLGNLSEVEDKETSYKFKNGGENNSTYVFSHQLKSNGGNMSYADESKKIMSPYLKDGKLKRPFDSISQSTIEQKMKNLKDKQEYHRESLGLTEPTGNNAYGSYLDNNPYYSGRMPKLFNYGGKIYADGGQTVDNNKLWDNSNFTPTYPSTGLSIKAPGYKPELNPETTNSANPYMQGVAIGSQLLPSIYGLTKNKQLPVNYQRVTPETLKYNANLSSTIGGINKSYAGLNQDLRNTATNEGSYLSSRIASGTSQAGDVGSTTAKTIENYDNINAQNRMQANMQNAQIQRGEVDSRAAEYDRYVSGQQKNLQNIGTVIGGVGRDKAYSDSEMYYDKSGVLQRGRPPYGYAKGGNLPKKIKNIINEIPKPNYIENYNTTFVPNYFPLNESKIDSNTISNSRKNVIKDLYRQNKNPNEIFNLLESTNEDNNDFTKKEIEEYYNELHPQKKKYGGYLKHTKRSHSKRYSRTGPYVNN